MTEVSNDKKHSVSDLMGQLVRMAGVQESMSLGEILQVFGVRGFAFMMLVLSLLNIAIFMVPLLSIVFGVPMMILSVQVILGLSAPVFPKILLNRSIGRRVLELGLSRAMIWVGWLERFIKPRFLIISSPSVQWLHGLVALMLSMMVALPVPIINMVPSFLLALLALGILQRDGLLIMIAYVGATGWGFWFFKSIRHIVMVS